MNKLPPYEEWHEHWSEGLPLPDADAAWADMKARLDADDRKRRFLLLPLLPCAGWTLLGAAVLGVGTWLLWPRNSAPTAPAGISQSSTGNPEAEGPHSANIENTNRTASAGSPSNSIKDNRTASTPLGTAPGEAVATTASTPKPQAENSNTNTATGNGTENGTAAPGHPSVQSAKTVTGSRTSTVKGKGQKDTSPFAIASRTKPKNTISNATPSKPTGSEPTENPDGDAQASKTGKPVSTDPGVPASPLTADSNSKTYTPPGAIAGLPPKVADSTAQTMPVDSNTVAAPEAPKKKGVKGWTFSAGLALHQAIPVGGQQSWPKNYAGKGNPFTEHVPALWFRAQKGRWALQAEARFGAPQLVPEYVFAQKTRWDTANHSVVTERQSLRKTWYHHFGGTVSYTILSGWSIGAGAQWSLLYRAYAERSLIRSDLAGNIQGITKEALPIGGFRDSFLYKTQWQLLLQTEYNWRRWTLGLRYRADLEPFISYTRPGGTVLDKRNEAFEAILRFRLWQKGARKK
jgi:hypothetical protein